MNPHKSAYCLILLLMGLGVRTAQTEVPVEYPLGQDPRNGTYLKVGFPSAKAPAKYTVLEQGLYSGVQTQRFETIRDEAGLRSLWQVHAKNLSPPADLPDVDFSKEMVIVAFAGQKNSGGYQLNITGFQRHDGHINVSLSLTQPGPDCLVTEAATQPYVIVKVKQSGEPISFQVSSKTFSCVTGKPL